ncbi:hypothetical protein [Actinoalloteichus caeruleus]|uniref:PPE family protein n=1 Tax=Actinoalloteichus caeruleus DSM 43889 TaxID=1120930 RepID=A0ABT1JK40_ACTCY|nr:hypothetical protein [Actinoalloteichus caeruleus]MCP2332865.1 hypothetical protein [Actinoalloteichus caeruleus DSM 43889]
MGINLNRANYSWEHTNAQAISAALRTDREGADPQEMVVTWMEIAQSFRALAEYLAATVRASVDSHEGEAAEAFRSSTLPLAGFAEECGAQAVEAAHAVHLQAEYLESARSLVPIGQPRPEKGFLDAILPGLTGYADAMDSWDQDNQRARDVMVEYQGNSNGVLGSTLGFDPQARVGELRVAAPPPVTPVSEVHPPDSVVEPSSAPVMSPRDERTEWQGGADPVDGGGPRVPRSGGGPSPDLDPDVEAAPPGGQPAGAIPQPSAAGQAPAVETRWATRETGGPSWTTTSPGVSSGAGPTAGGRGPGPFGMAARHPGSGAGAPPGRGPGPGGSGTAPLGPGPGVAGGGTTSPSRPGPAAGGPGTGLGGVPGGSTAGRSSETDDTPSHRRADYLVEMESLFDDDRRVAPPVLDGMNRPHEER